MAAMAASSSADLLEHDGSVSADSTVERAGSQNSSRDWGWFEDVHQSLNEATGGGLRTAAAATAATAGSAGGDRTSAVLQDDGGGGTHGQHGEAQHEQPSQSQQPPKKKRGWVPRVSSGGEIPAYSSGANQDAGGT
jgi:hypothetical protein